MCPIPNPGHLIKQLNPGQLTDEIAALLGGAPVPPSRNRDIAQEMMHRVPGIMTIIRRCPAYGDPIEGKPCIWASAVGTVEDAIIHLNDNHLWERERIADWVDYLEARGLDLTVNFDDETEPKAYATGGIISSGAVYLMSLGVHVDPISPGTVPGTEGEG